MNYSKYKFESYSHLLYQLSRSDRESIIYFHIEDNNVAIAKYGANNQTTANMISINTDLKIKIYL